MHNAEEKVGVFKIDQHADIHKKAYNEVQRSFPVIFGAGNLPCQVIIHYCRDEQKDKIQSARFVIEKNGKQCQIYIFKRIVLINNTIHSNKPKEQEQKETAAENHRLFWIVHKFL